MFVFLKFFVVLVSLLFFYSKLHSRETLPGILIKRTLSHLLNDEKLSCIRDTIVGPAEGYHGHHIWRKCFQQKTNSRLRCFLLFIIKSSSVPRFTLLLVSEIKVLFHRLN